MQGIRNAKIILKDSIIEKKVLLYDRRIRGIEERVDSAAVSEWFDAAGCYLSPGFIDIHIHGAGGADTMDGDAGALAALARNVCSGGTSAFLPTTMTAPLKDIRRALGAIREGMKNQRAGGARILGAHLEGPFINPAYQGAQDEAHILPPAVEPIRDYLDTIKVISFAPELDRDFSFTREIRRHGQIVLSIGHSGATYEEALASISVGVSGATHTFNAMTGLHHRQPGAAGAVLLSDIYCELVADNSMIHPAIYSILRKLKGPDKLILVTDSLQPAGLADGSYLLAGREVVVANGSPRLADGTLAGSVHKMNEVVRNFQAHTGCPLPEAVRMASLNPAALLGWHDRKGSIEVGKDADFAILDQSLAISAVFVEGSLTYQKGA